MNIKIKILFVTLILFGCSSMELKDDVSRLVSRGYAEFYYLQSEGEAPARIGIYIIQDGLRILEGQTGAWGTDDKVGLRVAKKPGDFKYVVVLGGAYINVDVKVLENMITPVKIFVKNIQKSVKRDYSGNIIKFNTDFTLSVAVQNPIPVASTL